MAAQGDAAQGGTTPHGRRFRFGLQIDAGAGSDVVGVARRAEAAGFDVLLAADHVGPGLAPLPVLGAAAAATERLRVGTLVLNNDLRNPVQVAWDVASLDHLSGGRVELGLGAGHTAQEYAACGVPFDSAPVRKARLAEATVALRALLDGERFSAEGEHYHLDGARTLRAVQARLPILVGGSGRRLLADAAAHADIVGLTGLGRTLPDGHRHRVRWDPEHLDAQVAAIRRAAGSRWGELELNALVQVVTVTDDRQAALEAMVEQTEGLSLDHARTTPFLMVGTPDQMAQHLLECRRRWGITYYAVRDLDAVAPVIDGLRGR
jgi:probable F420-dependent oxidoreductase